MRSTATKAQKVATPKFTKVSLDHYTTEHRPMTPSEKVGMDALILALRSKYGEAVGSKNVTTEKGGKDAL